MKTTFSGVAAFALALAVGGTVLAQTPAVAPHRARMAEPVSQADFVQRRVERLRAADANGDGQVTAEEIRARAQARRAERGAKQAERRAALFERLDANKDGSLSRAEFEASPARGDHAGRMTRGHRGMGGRGMAQRAENRFPIVIADAERKAGGAFTRMDANGDGALSVEERRAAMQANRVAMRLKHEQRRMERRSGTPAASPSTPASE